MIRLNNDWQFIESWDNAFLFQDEVKDCKSVRLPHTVKELSLHYCDSDAYQMISGYRRILKLTDDMKGKRLFLQFDGAAHIATVYVNGKELLTHRSGYTAFRVEFTSVAKFDEDNVISVKLDSTENSSIPPFGFVIDYLTYGGIYRDVWLDVRSQDYLEDVYVTTNDVHSCDVTYLINGNTDGKTILVEILDENEKVIMQSSQDASKGKIHLDVAEAKPWDTETPNLYQAKVSIIYDHKVLDTVYKTFGFRVISINHNQLLLNGKPVFVRGLNRHQCFPYVGYAVPEALQREDARIMQEELQLNATRTSHYPQSHYFLDECDRRGLLVFTEIPGWQHIGESAEWKNQCVENVHEMVMQYRQHPSIFMWGVRVNESQDDDELYTRTNAMAHQLDPMRPTSGVRYIEKSSLLEDVYSYNDFSHMGTNPGAKNKKDVTPDLNKPLLISEANGHMFPTKSYDPYEKRQEHALRHARVLDVAMKDGEHMGCYQWCMFDYPTHQDFGSGDRICYHGVMDMYRNPKLAASVYESQGDDHPVLEIGTPMDIGDYPAGQIGKIYAFTNADEVDLYKNEDYVATFKSNEFEGLKHGPILIDDTIGKLLETKEGMDAKQASLIRECLLAARDYGMANLPLQYKLKLGYAMAKYKLKFADGYRLYGSYVGNWGGKATEWKFVAKKDGEPIKTVIKTPNAKLHMDVKASHTKLVDHEVYDMASIRIRLLDEYQNIASYCQSPIYVETTGPIEIVGNHVVTAEGGMCGTYIKTTGKSGEATVTLKCEMCQPVTIQFKVEGE